MLDRLFKTVQELMNKEQLGSIKPLAFNLFAYNAIIINFNSLLVDVKVSVRKENWNLQGKFLADLSGKKKQLLEYYLTSTTIDGSPSKDGLDVIFNLTDDIEFVEEVLANNIKIDKIDLQDYNLLRRNIYSPPTAKKPFCTKIGNKLKVLPITIDEIDITYLRTPKVPNWTYIDYQSRAMFNPLADDFEDLDIPESMFDDVLLSVLEQAGLKLRDRDVMQAINSEQSQDSISENRQ